MRTATMELPARHRRDEADALAVLLPRLAMEIITAEWGPWRVAIMVDLEEGMRTANRLLKVNRATIKVLNERCGGFETMMGGVIRRR